jgi:thiamine pyrophosphate-dependent acetolactate synthase large subunit-like protein
MTLPTTEERPAPSPADDREYRPFPAVVARAIAAEGVSDVFGLMGAGTIQLTHHLAEEGVTTHAARHESGAVGAADGFARVAHDVGVCTVTWGPAVTNALTALTTARRGHTPLVFVAGDSSTMPRLRSPFAAGTQGVDQARVLAAFDIPVVRAHPDTAVADVAHAFAQARLHSTPIALLLPMEYLDRPARATSPPEQKSSHAATRPSSADEDALLAVARLLSESQRPLILAGRGAVESQARDALVQLADRTGALLSTSLRAVGLFSGHPYDVGVAGAFAPPVIADLLRQADCVVGFGASMNQFTMMSGTLFPDAAIVQCDVNASALHAYYHADLAVCGDARQVAQALLEKLGDGFGSGSFRAAADQAGLSPASLRHEFPDVSRPGALDPRAVCRRLDNLLPRDRTVVTDAGQFCEYPVESMRFNDPDSLLWMMDFGAVGAGFGAAIGAAIGRPDRTTVLFIGDGGFFMSMGELDLAVRDRTPLLIVCMNDRAYGSELYHMRDMGVPLDAAFFDTPELDAVARAMGAHAERVTTLEQLDALAPRFASLDGPLFLDCILTQDFLPTPLRESA